jgi:hypothetical protein
LSLTGNFVGSVQSWFDADGIDKTHDPKRGSNLVVDPLHHAVQGYANDVTLRISTRPDW